MPLKQKFRMSIHLLDFHIFNNSSQIGTALQKRVFKYIEKFTSKKGKFSDKKFW